MKQPLFFLFFLLVTGLVKPHAQINKYHRLQVKASLQQIQHWQERELLPPHFSYRNGVIEMELGTEEFIFFKKQKIAYKDISKTFYKQQAKWEQAAQQTASRFPVPANYTSGSMGGFHTYDETMAVIDDMRQKFPHLVSAKDTLTLTYEGRPMVVVRISDNPDVDESTEDEWLMTAMHHANEVLGNEVSMYFIWYLLEHYATDPEIKRLLDNSALYYVPVINPDGLAYNQSTHPSGGGDWRKNRKPRVVSGTTHYGIDLNRNYGYRWAYTHAGQLGQAGSSFAGNPYYRGTAAWSELETQAIRNLCNSRRFTAAFNYHAWDDSFNYPWNYDIDLPTDDSPIFNAIAQYCTVENKFEKGTFNRTLGYTAAGTSDDWMYGEQTSKDKIFALTIEVGRTTFWPAEPIIKLYCDSMIPANIKMLRMAAQYAAVNEHTREIVSSLSHHLDYTIQRFSIKSPTYTVTVTPLDPEITSAAVSKTFTDLTFLESREESIPYTLSPGIADGTVFRFSITVDNGQWSYTDIISKTYRAMTTLPIDCIDQHEPNNTSGVASFLANGMVTLGSIDRVGDEDWFYFESTIHQRNARIILFDLPADYDVELYSSAGNRIGLANRSGNADDTIVLNNLPAGTYRARIYGYKKAYHPRSCYQLSIELGADKFPLTEPAGYKEKEQSSANFVAYPLPASQQVNIAIRAGTSQRISWSITDNNGRSVSTGSWNVQQGSSVQTISLDRVLPGFYLLHLSSPGMINPVYLKIVKQ